MPNLGPGRWRRSHAPVCAWFPASLRLSDRSSSTDGDCRPTRAYISDDGMWYALLDGRWVPVPPKVVLKQLAPDGSSHICASKSGMIYCFLGGSPKS